MGSSRGEGRRGRGEEGRRGGGEEGRRGGGEEGRRGGGEEGRRGGGEEGRRGGGEEGFCRYFSSKYANETAAISGPPPISVRCYRVILEKRRIASA